MDPLQVSIGWLALASQQGNGYVSEAVGKVVDLLFGSLDAHRIIAEIITGNDASVRLAERLGFRREAHFVESLKLNGDWRDELVYSILKDDGSPTPPYEPGIGAVEAEGPLPIGDSSSRPT